MRWRSNGLFLLALAILASSACTAPEDRPVPQRFPLSRLLAQTPSERQCPVTEHRDPLQLLGVTAFGLEGPQWWSPGLAVKVNWAVQHPTGTSQELAPLTVRLRRHGAKKDEYALKLPPGPSLVAFPGPGCWILAVERAGERAETPLFIRSDRPQALILSTQNGVPPAPGTGVGHPVLRDLAPLLHVLERASWRPVPPHGMGSRLDLLWQSGWLEPMLYVPTGNGEGPLLVVSRRLLTGQCDAAGYVAVPLPDSLASQMDRGIPGEAEAKLQDLPRLGGGCTPFVPIQ